MMKHALSTMRGRVVVDPRRWYFLYNKIRRLEIMTRYPSVAASPYPWPINGWIEPARAAILIIDMQADFCAPGGYMDSMGFDTTPLRAPIKPIGNVLEAARAAGLMVIHTRQGYRADHADFPEFRRVRNRYRGAAPGQDGPSLVRGTPGWEIIDELAPAPGEAIVDKRANGAFHGTDLADLLMARGISQLAFCGNTIDVCVHTTLRDANDRGFECLLLADCCGCVDPALHAAAVEMVTIEDGVFGCSATSVDFVAAFGGQHRPARSPG
jgi:biuret amidohydrolase